MSDPKGKCINGWHRYGLLREQVTLLLNTGTVCKEMKPRNAPERHNWKKEINQLFSQTKVLIQMGSSQQCCLSAGQPLCLPLPPACLLLPSMPWAPSSPLSWFFLLRSIVNNSCARLPGGLQVWWLCHPQRSAVVVTPHPRVYLQTQSTLWILLFQHRNLGLSQSKERRDALFMYLDGAYVLMKPCICNVQIFEKVLFSHWTSFYFS